MAYYEAIQSMLQDSRLPACAASCIDAICPGLNATESCICPSRRLHYPPWEPGLDDCMFNGCFQKDYLVVAGLTYHACDLPQPEMTLIPLIIVTTVVEILFFSIRVWAIRKKGHSRGYDDISISIAFGLLMCWIPMLCLEQYYGFYKNVWTGEIVGLDHVTMVFFAYEIIYCTALGFTKISIAFLYFRILDGKVYRWLLWATQIFNVLLICSFLIGLFVSCTPLPRYWIYSYDIVGTCSDVWDWGGYYMGLNLLLDIWLIVLPSQYVWKAVMDRRTKLGVIAMFGLGLITMAMTAMRFVAMRADANTIAGDDLMQGLLWGTLEVTIAFVIACIPSTRLFVQHFFPVIATRISSAVSSRPSKHAKRHAFSTITSSDEGAGPRGGPRALLRGSQYGPSGDSTTTAKALARSTLEEEENGLQDLEFIPLSTLEEERRRSGVAM